MGQQHCITFQFSKRTGLDLVSSAVATQFPDGGRTVHSALLISIPIISESICHIEVDSANVRKLSKYHFITSDKIVVKKCHNLKAVDRTLGHICRLPLSSEKMPCYV